MYYPAELERLLNQYENASTKEERYIKRLLEDTEELLALCDAKEYYYAEKIVQNLCRVLELQEKQRSQVPEQRLIGWQSHPRDSRFTSDWELAQAFYNYYKEQGQVDYLEIRKALAEGRKDLVNPTMKDYVARIYTFSGPRYLGEMFTADEIGDRNPVLFTYENIELILATFKTRDENGEIVKQRVNIRSALRKLNDFKHETENR